MLTPSARELWPFFVRFSAPSPAWIARAAPAARARRRRAGAVIHIRIFLLSVVFILLMVTGNLQLRAAADCLPALGSFCVYFSITKEIGFDSGRTQLRCWSFGVL